MASIQWEVKQQYQYIGSTSSLFDQFLFYLCCHLRLSLQPVASSLLKLPENGQTKHITSLSCITINGWLNSDRLKSKKALQALLTLTYLKGRQIKSNVIIMQKNKIV